MTKAATPTLDRADSDRVYRSPATHVDVNSPQRGAMEQARDGAQHRRFTALWDDLMN